jgi:hypothetical protein
MIRRSVAALSAALLALAVLALPAAAEEPTPTFEWVDHGHVLLLGATYTQEPGEPPVVHSFERCVPLAGGRVMALSSLHDKVHMGNANRKGLASAGHLVQPIGIIGYLTFPDGSSVPIDVPADCAAWDAEVHATD